MNRLLIALVTILIATAAFAQNSKDSSANKDNTFQQMLDYSRPGRYHYMLEELTGNWTFKGSHLEWVDSVTSKESVKLAGSLTRKPFAYGRFFITELTTAAKIALPVRNGKMINDHAKAIQLEGYNNVSEKFQFSYINSHIGSDITFWQGTYDAAARTIVFYAVFEDTPDVKTNARFDFIFNDKDHYQWNYYSEKNGRYIKDTEIYFTRVKAK
ncbi:MAG: DUF1579 family protein [Chitinophagaceae bacterium]|nr:DUF1579 family protein [Chitinophagaceae bacterium]